MRTRHFTRLTMLATAGLAALFMGLAPAARAGAPALAWTYTWSGAGSGNDWMNAVAVDTCGNVFGGGPVNSGATLRVVKLDVNGAIQWTDSVGGATGGEVIRMAIDHTGNVLVVGYYTVAGQGQNAFLRKYTTNGLLLWERTYNSAATNNDWFSRVALDSADNPVVSGVEIRTDLGQSDNWIIRKYDINGNLLWSRSYNNPLNSFDDCRGLAIDAGDNVIAGGFERVDVGGQEANWLIRKYDLNGTLLWSRTHNNPVTASDDEVDAVNVDSAGNIYAAGHIFIGPWPNYDWMIRKYDANGNVLWTKSYATASGEDWPRDAVMLSDGTYAVGGLHTPGTNRDWLVINYDPAGNVQWTLTFAGADGLDDSVLGMAADSCGNLYVAGEENTATAGDNWRLMKYGAGAYAGCACAGPPPPPPPTTTPPPVDGKATVKIVGGVRGYLNPKQGEQATILVKTSGTGAIKVRIFDRLGRLVREILATASGNGTVVLKWNATDAGGQPVPAGIYPIVVEAPGITYQDKLAVLR